MTVLTGLPPQWLMPDDVLRPDADSVRGLGAVCVAEYCKLEAWQQQQQLQPQQQRLH
jgi:hypothetical protein